MGLLQVNTLSVTQWEAIIYDITYRLNSISEYWGIRNIYTKDTNQLSFIVKLRHIPVNQERTIIELVYKLGDTILSVTDSEECILFKEVFDQYLQLCLRLDTVINNFAQSDE